MSNGLTDASFFPTAKELSTGLQWFRDHPMLAAAAATAVSVITYLNTVETLSRSSSSASHFDDAPQDYDWEDGDVGGNTGNTGSSSSYSGSALHRKREAVMVVAATRSAFESSSKAAGDSANGAQASPATAALSGSDEKLSAAVSWCDEHGGSLTQVFDGLQLAGERIERSRGVGSGSGAAGADPGIICDENVNQLNGAPRPVGSSAIKKSSTQQSILSAMEAPSSRSGSAEPLNDAVPAFLPTRLEASISEHELQSESPQWGWYVAITPPQDHLHPNLPRVALQPCRTAPCSGNTPNAKNHIATANATSSLRRSTSGRIP